ncbi:hypothetical protein ACFLZP_05135, partial [Patescibacteria group bacterium]
MPKENPPQPKIESIPRESPQEEKTLNLGIMLLALLLVATIGGIIYLYLNLKKPFPTTSKTQNTIPNKERTFPLKETTPTKQTLPQNKLTWLGYENNDLGFYFAYL